MKILVTGGCGFIGCHFIRVVIRARPEVQIINLDALTYAGKLENLDGIDQRRHPFVKGNICDARLVDDLFNRHGFSAVVNFAAESHVDKSIEGPRVFIQTNVNGTLNLLDCAYRYWKRKPNWQEKCRFLQISTDEVYGSLSEDPKRKFTEDLLLQPSSAYSASKAASDLLALAYHKTYGMPVIITRCSNNFGPNQDPEKLIPLVITRALNNQKCPVYGDGKNIRDWIYVDDHCEAVRCVLENGKTGQIYNVGGTNERSNIEVVKILLKLLGRPESLIEFVTDRLGHDRRYAIDSRKIQKELGWKPKVLFCQGLEETVKWYRHKPKAKEVKHAT